MAVLVLVVAIGTFLGALYYTGALDSLTAGEFDWAAMLGGSTPETSQPETTTPVPTASVEPTEIVIPDEAGRRMFYEQIASQPTIEELLANKFDRFDYGDVTTKGPLTRVAVTARYRKGGSFKGTMTLRNYGGNWYFYSIAREADSPSRLPTSPTYDPDVVEVILQEQAAQQENIEEVIDGTHSSFVVDRVDKGFGTASVIAKQVGDTEAKTIVVLEKSIEGEPYWFVTSIK